MSPVGRAASRPIVAVVGATAAGKTGLSLDLAERLDGETVAEFQGWAREVISAVRARRRTPILVGGSALYTRAVVDRFEFPGTDPALRAELEAELADVGPAELHRRLAALDPESAAQILPENGRRVVRALEVVTITGAGFRAALPEPVYADAATVQIGVDIDRATLDTRIEERVKGMFDDGLVDEVRRLLAVGLAEGRTARSAIGYREVTSYLEGRLTLDQAIDALKRYPEIKVELDGHTDSIGTDAYNQKLSERRAQIVSDYLTSHGIDSSRITAVKGFGETQPIDTNATKEGRARNRRTELKVENPGQ